MSFLELDQRTISQLLGDDTQALRDVCQVAVQVVGHPLSIPLRGRFSSIYTTSVKRHAQSLRSPRMAQFQ